MKLNLTFTESDFASFKAFEKAVTKQVGNTVYVGTNSLCVYFDYPKELVEQLRPFPTSKKMEFDLESSKP